METISGTFSEFPVQMELVNIDDVKASKKFITGTRDNSSSADVLLTNDDLLIEILLRLPIISLYLFKSVSKRWLSIITSPNFTQRRNQISNLDPPSGFFLQRYESSSFICDFMPLDSRISSRKSLLDTFPFGSTEAGNDVQISHSCNGLLLCNNLDVDVFYIYNPSTNLYKMLPQRHVSNSEPTYTIGGMTMAFDPTKSPYYKVVFYETILGDGVNIQIQIYSSETGNWSVCSDGFRLQSFNNFNQGIYWNDAIHWLDKLSKPPMHFKLEIVNHDHPTLKTVQTPQALDWDGALFESRGCLLLLCRDYTQFREINIYEMRIGNSLWSIKYFVNLDDFIFPLPKSLMVYYDVMGIVLGEKEEDSFMVIILSGKAVEYKFLSKTLRKLYDLGSTSEHFLFTYQFIASLATV